MTLPAAGAAPADPRRFDYIDALRGVAILLVIFVHVQQRCDMQTFPAWMVTLGSSGARGVQLFYVVSALTLFHSLHGRAGREARPIANFFLRRLFRIAPLFWCAMAFYLWHDGRGPRYWLGDAERITDANILATATFANGWNPYWITSIVPGGWSVAIEMTFYLTIPLWFAVVRSLRAAWWLTLLATVAAIGLNRLLLAYPLISNQPFWWNFVQLWFFNQLPAFCLGLVTYFLLRDAAARRSVSHDGDIAQPTAALRQAADGRLMLGGALALFGLLAFETNSLLPTPAVYGLVFLLLTLGVARFPHGLLVNRFFCFFGTISYSAYLSHVAVLKFLAPRLRDLRLATEQQLQIAIPESVLLGVLLIVGLAGVALVSYTTYRLIETPGIALGRRIILALERRASGRAAARLIPG